MPVIQRCIMHDYPLDIAACAKCCMLVRNGVLCWWLTNVDTTDVVTTVLKRLIRVRKDEKMFVLKDKKGKLEVHPGIINLLDPMAALGDIKLDEIEEIYEVSRVFKPERVVKLKTIDGLPTTAKRTRKKKEPAPEPTQD